MLNHYLGKHKSIDFILIYSPRERKENFHSFSKR